MEEVRDELRASVRGYMCQYAMLSEDMEKEELCKLRGSNCIMSGYEDDLL